MKKRYSTPAQQAEAKRKWAREGYQRNAEVRKAWQREYERKKRAKIKEQLAELAELKQKLKCEGATI